MIVRAVIVFKDDRSKLKKFLKRHGNTCSLTPTSYKGIFVEFERKQQQFNIVFSTFQINRIL